MKNAIIPIVAVPLIDQSLHSTSTPPSALHLSRFWVEAVIPTGYGI